MCRCATDNMRNCASTYQGLPVKCCTSVPGKASRVMHCLLVIPHGPASTNWICRVHNRVPHQVRKPCRMLHILLPLTAPQAVGAEKKKKCFAAIMAPETCVWVGGQTWAPKVVGWGGAGRVLQCHAALHAGLTRLLMLRHVAADSLFV